MLLEQDDLVNDLGIKSGIIRKKILNCRLKKTIFYSFLLFIFFGLIPKRPANFVNFTLLGIGNGLVEYSQYVTNNSTRTLFANLYKSNCRYLFHVY